MWFSPVMLPLALAAPRFVADEPAGTALSIEVDQTHVVDLTDAVGYSLSTSEQPTNSIAVVTDYAEPHYVFVAATEAGPSTVRVNSSHPLARWNDPDDDQVVGSFLEFENGFVG